MLACSTNLHKKGDEVSKYLTVTIGRQTYAPYLASFSTNMSRGGVTTTDKGATGQSIRTGVQINYQINEEESKSMSRYMKAAA